jgi:hypothetical protein
LIFAIVLGKVEAILHVAMARYRIIRRPDQESPYANNFEVEERAPYMSPSGECIATYWQLIAGPFPVLDYAEIYVEKAIEIEKDQRFVVKEYYSVPLKNTEASAMCVLLIIQ